MITDLPCRPLSPARALPTPQANAREITNIVIIVIVVLLVVGAVAGLSSYYYSRKDKRDNSAAPKHSERAFAVMFTDIQSSTNLWARIPLEMTNALHMHHTEIRVLIRKHKCYEVKTIGDAFMIVCESPERMLRLALELQTRFHQMDWKTDAINALYIESELEKAESIQGESQAVWNGLRVRCGLHYGKGDVQYDLVTKGYDYYGTVVNAASRIESVCHGGQVGLSQEFWEAVGCNFAGTTVLDLGQNELRGLNAPIRLYQVNPFFKTSLEVVWVGLVCGVCLTRRAGQSQVMYSCIWGSFVGDPGAPLVVSKPQLQPQTWVYPLWSSPATQSQVQS